MSDTQLGRPGSSKAEHRRKVRIKCHSHAPPAPPPLLCFTSSSFSHPIPPAIPSNLPLFAISSGRPLDTHWTPVLLNPQAPSSIFRRGSTTSEFRHRRPFSDTSRISNCLTLIRRGFPRSGRSIRWPSICSHSLTLHAFRPVGWLLHLFEFSSPTPCPVPTLAHNLSAHHACSPFTTHHSDSRSYQLVSIWNWKLTSEQQHIEAESAAVRCVFLPPHHARHSPDQARITRLILPTFRPPCASHVPHTYCIIH